MFHTNEWHLWRSNICTGTSSTFARLCPKIKAKYDYGFMIFILTFSFIAISGYREDALLRYAYLRLETIIIGCGICILISLLICPIWAGEDLHKLIICNLEGLARSLEGKANIHVWESSFMCIWILGVISFSQAEVLRFNIIMVVKPFHNNGPPLVLLLLLRFRFLYVSGSVAEYFQKYSHEDTDNDNVYNGYKCILNSKANEEALVRIQRNKLLIFYLLLMISFLFYLISFFK
jgi:hypothetical protein